MVNIDASESPSCQLCCVAMPLPGLLRTLTHLVSLFLVCWCYGSSPCALKNQCYFQSDNFSLHYALNFVSHHLTIRTPYTLRNVLELGFPKHSRAPECHSVWMDCSTTSAEPKSKRKRSIQFCWDKARLTDYLVQFKYKKKGKAQKQQLSAKLGNPFSLTQKVNEG